MFDVYCPQHGSRVLLDLTSIDSIVHTTLGLDVHYRCYCGHEGVWTTGHKVAAA